MAEAPTMVAPSKPTKVEPKEVIVQGEKVIEGSNEHLALTQQYDISKKYVFELAVKNLERELPVIGIVGTKARAEPHVEFKPYQNLVMTSQIIWKGERRNIRYYDGCTSLFTNHQPDDIEEINQLKAQTKQHAFLEGKLGITGDERMLLIYLDICSWNIESIFRTRTATSIFLPVNADKKATAKSSRLDLIEEAMKYAKDATSTKMKIHADYLGIPMLDYDSGNELTEKELRTAYREKASQDPVNFIETYGNRNIEIKYYIDKALLNGDITNKHNPNKATWASGNNTVITDISGLRTHEAIAQALFEFSQSEAGEEFVIQLKAISE